MPRIFAAVVPPPEAVEHLDAFLEPRRAAAEFRWTRPEQFHVTLAFMEAAQERRVDGYVDRLAESLEGLGRGSVRLSGSVVFPNVSQGRVLATDVLGDAPLAQLATRTRNAAVAEGIEVDGQRFRPHLTVARTGGRPTELTSWVRLLESYDGPPWPLAEIEVVASYLGEGPRRAPRYETRAVIEL